VLASILMRFLICLLNRDSNIHRRKRYGIFYKVYRRIRYLCYVRKKKKKTIRELRQLQREELRLAREKGREQLQNDLLEDRKRKHLEREQQAAEFKSQKAAFSKAAEEYQPVLKAQKEQVKKKQEAESVFLRKRRRRLIRFYFRNSGRRLKRWILSLNYKNFKKWLRNYKSRKQERRNLYSIAVNSTSLFILSYLFVYLFSLLVTSISGTFFEYSSTIYYYDIYFNIRSDQWHHDAVKVIYSSAPVALLFIGTILLIVFSYIREDKGLYKMFFFWGFLHSYTMFFGGVLVGTIFGTGLGHAINWSYILDTGKMVYSIISLAIFILIGVLSSKSFLLSANTYYNYLTGSVRSKFVWAQMVIPFLAGNIMMFVFRMPVLKTYYIFVGITMVLVVIPAWVSTSFYPTMYFHEDPVSIKPSWKLIALAIIVYIILRLLLGVGILIDFT